ncbi:recombinase family protein [Weissella muntiaci]|uniref:Recombinase family protein n=1 Tax=Weissella muntiaci TaxID=2508881 RepID=A0A6C2CCF1_9LACO|nr:recombinase family protein [Weissella muntiaci]TYC50835.1 recombinase family protein [Weissella muntiaci]
MIYGYARVSTKDQNLDRQLKALNDYGVDKIYSEAESGAENNRPQLNKLLKKLKHGDTFIVMSLDRLSRDPEFLTKIIVLLDTRGIQWHALDVPEFDEIENQHTQRFLHSIIIELKKYLAAEERKRILERQKQGIEIAKQKGLYTGRKILYGPDVTNKKRQKLYYDIVDKLNDGQTIYSITKELGCSNTLVYRIQRELVN